MEKTKEIKQKRPPKPRMNVIFINPNTPEEVEKVLHDILMERIIKKLSIGGNV